MDVIAAIDIGGTHARFAVASVEDGRVVSIGEVFKSRTAEFDGLASAWARFGERLGREPPRRAGMAFAGPVDGEVLKLTNSAWTIPRAEIAADLGLEELVLVNDFGAMGHAAARAKAADLGHVCGPAGPIPDAAVISIVGAGTGLGVALAVRNEAGGYRVVETEGGHVGFAPADGFEDDLLARLRARHGRVSVERVVSGPGLAAIFAAVEAGEGGDAPPRDDAGFWAAAIAGNDAPAAEALRRFCRAYGGACGDFALAHGADAVIVAGGLTGRIAGRLAELGFAERFEAKGRFAGHMRRIPVRWITHPEPGLLGAACAYAALRG